MLAGEHDLRRVGEWVRGEPEADELAGGVDDGHVTERQRRSRSEAPASRARRPRGRVMLVGDSPAAVDLLEAKRQSNLEVLRCFDAENGVSEGDDIAAAMSKLLPTSASIKGNISVGSAIENEFNAGDWVVTFALSGSPRANSFTTTN
jgi:hypothetical protein